VKGRSGAPQRRRKSRTKRPRRVSTRRRVRSRRSRMRGGGDAMLEAIFAERERGSISEEVSLIKDIIVLSSRYPKIKRFSILVDSEAGNLIKLDASDRRSDIYKIEGDGIYTQLQNYDQTRRHDVRTLYTAFHMNKQGTGYMWMWQNRTILIDHEQKQISWHKSGNVKPLDTLTSITGFNQLAGSKKGRAHRIDVTGTSSKNNLARILELSASDHIQKALFIESLVAAGIPEGASAGAAGAAAGAGGAAAGFGLGFVTPPADSGTPSDISELLRTQSLGDVERAAPAPKEGGGGGANPQSALQRRRKAAIDKKVEFDKAKEAKAKAVEQAKAKAVEQAKAKAVEQARASSSSEDAESGPGWPGTSECECGGQGGCKRCAW
jgi:hypothetical protein